MDLEDRVKVLEAHIDNTRVALEERVAGLEEFSVESKRDRAELHESLKRGRWMRTIAWVVAFVVVIAGTWSMERQHDADRQQDARAEAAACVQRRDGREALRGLVLYVIEFNPTSKGSELLQSYLDDKLAPIACP